MPKLYKLKREGIAYYFGSWDNMNRAIDQSSSDEAWSRRDLHFMQLADFAVDTKTNTSETQASYGRSSRHSDVDF